MFNYTNFVTKNKSLVIAPAGYGKTHTIAECLKFTPVDEQQLILTHTHAGIASIKEKIKKLGIPNSKYQVETITSFAQRYVLSFYTQNDIPDQENAKEYYSFIIKKATEIFKYHSIKRIIIGTYKGLFVDEYQDCTKSQHQMILALADILPTHLLGDPLQGIMNFDNDLVDFKIDLIDFEIILELDTPHRWYTDGNNKDLGDALKEIRGLLLNENKKVIDLSKYNIDKILHIIKIEDGDIYNPKSLYRKCLRKLIENPEGKSEFESLLILVPEYLKDGKAKGNVFDRAKLRTQIDYKRKLVLIEAIDDKTFYSIAKKIDAVINSIGTNKYKIKKICSDIISPLFETTCINEWFKESENRLIQKKGSDANKIMSEKLRIIIDAFITTPSPKTLKNILVFLKNDLHFKYKRDGLLFSIIKALDNAYEEKQSVYLSMISHKNVLRRIGRKIKGKCIGTTALTKGLEFDTVAILDAHEFTCPKNFYVALTRASKKLIIFTRNEKPFFN